MKNKNQWTLFIAEIPYVDLMMVFPMVSVVILYVIPEKTYAVIVWACFQIVMVMYLVQKYNKVKRLLRNGTIIQTKVLEICKSPLTLSSNFDIIIRSSYFDNHSGRQYLFERTLHEQRGFVDEEKDDVFFEKLKEIEVLVDLKNANEYIVLVEEYLLFEIKGQLSNIVIIISVWLVYLILLLKLFLI